MKHACSISFVLFAALLLTSGPSASDASQTPKVSVSPKIMAAAKEWLHRFQIGDIDRSQLSDQLNAQLTDAVLKKAIATVKPFGRPTKFEYLGSEQIQFITGYVFGATCRSGLIEEHIAFDADGKIAGIDFHTFVPR